MYKYHIHATSPFSQRKICEIGGEQGSVVPQNEKKVFRGTRKHNVGAISLH